VPRENEAVNEVWLADRDRYSHTGMYSDDRLSAPMIREDGQWRECDWSEALEHTTHALRKIVAEHGADALGALASPGASVEELYLLQKLMRGIGCGNIDHRLRQTDFSDQEQFPVAPGLGMGIDDLQSVNAVLLVGSNARKEHPLLNHRLRKAVIDGAAAMTLNPMDYGFNYPLAEQITTGPGQYAACLQKLAKASGAMKTSAARLKDAENAVILLGPGVLNHPDAAYLRALASAAASACGARLGLLTEGGNSSGAWLAGAVPHRGSGGEATSVSGIDAKAMLETPRKGYVLLGVEPELDCSNSAQALAAMDAAQLVIAITAYDSPRLRDSAHIMLPMALFAETAGTWVNMSGLWQSATGAVAPFEQSRPAWKILRVLGNLHDLAGFDYDDAFEIRDQLSEQCAQLAGSDAGSWPARKSQSSASKAEQDATIYRLGDVPVYATDALLRRAAPLQQTADAQFDGLQIGRELASSLGLGDGQRARVSQRSGSTSVGAVAAEAVFTVKIVDSMAPGCVRLPSGLANTVGLGCSHGVAAISAV
jgi:NADH-quinone oxidoreductase subunit G